MTYFHHTNVPNNLFDIHLNSLGYAEIKVLLVIIRQTHGWKDRRTGSYKKWDWISGQFFVKKTGLSQRSVSSAISLLIKKRLIAVKNSKGKVLSNEIQRKHEHKLYFSCTLLP